MARRHPDHMTRLLGALFAATALLIASGCDKASGRLAVVRLCKQDGGLRIAETTYAEGYINLGRFRDPNCQECIEELARGTFEYVDVMIPPAEAGSGLFKEAGYFRVQRSSTEDPLCQPFLGRQDLVTAARKAGLPSDVCIAVRPLPARPAGFVYRTDFRRIDTPEGVPLGVSEQIIERAPGGEVMAVDRDYIFTSTWAYVFDFGGRGGRVDASCRDAAQIKPMLPSAVRKTVLKDPNARTN